MNDKTKLCPRCRTGREMYEKDKRSDVCPYLAAYTGKTCAWFVEITDCKGAKKE